MERDVLQLLGSGETPPEIRRTPLAAKMAEDLGVSLEDMVGSGPGGRVRAEDVRRAASRRSAPAIEAREIPLQGMRKSSAVTGWLEGGEKRYPGRTVNV